MFARRRNDDGFEWRSYVRTTIKRRREERRQRLLQARRAAASQAGAAGKALVEGSRAAGAAARDGARAGFWGAALLLQGLVLQALALGATLARAAGTLAQPLISWLARPGLGIPVALAGAISVGCGVGRLRAAGLDGEAVLMLLLGATALASVLPLLSAVTGIVLPRPSARGITLVGATAAAAAVLLAAGLGRLPLSGFSMRLPFSGSPATLTGKADVLGGDRLRVGSRVVRLAGIEAPDPRQRCGLPGRSWRCSAAASAALARLVRGRAITCTLSGGDGVCRTGETDIGAQMVREGHVFAAGGLFASYAGLEREARSAGVGIWSGGSIERPGEYRARLGTKSRLSRSKEASAGGS